jgi:hypothetical protein
MSAFIERQLADIPALDWTDVARLVDQIFDGEIIPILMRDPTLPPRSYGEWALVLADASDAVADHLHRRLHGACARR